MKIIKPFKSVFFISFLFLWIGCQKSTHQEEVKILLQKDIPSLVKAIRNDFQAIEKGMYVASSKLAPFVEKKEEVNQVDLLRKEMMKLREINKGINAFATSPIGFIAAIDLNGIVIARDKKEDAMKGKNFGKLYPTLNKILKGEIKDVPHEVLPFQGKDTSIPPSMAIVFMKSVEVEGQIVGAIMVGISLKKMAKRLALQLKLENTDLIYERYGSVWAGLLYGDRTYDKEIHAELAEVCPTKETREKALSKSEGGYVSKVEVFRKDYVYGVLPLKTLLPGVDLIVFRHGH